MLENRENCHCHGSGGPLLHTHPRALMGWDDSCRAEVRLEGLEVPVVPDLHGVTCHPIRPSEQF